MVTSCDLGNFDGRRLGEEGMLLGVEFELCVLNAIVPFSIAHKCLLSLLYCFVVVVVVVCC